MISLLTWEGKQVVLVNSQPVKDQYTLIGYTKSINGQEKESK